MALDPVQLLLDIRSLQDELWASAYVERTTCLPAPLSQNGDGAHPEPIVTPAKLMDQALEHHCPHLDGVQLCLHQLLRPAPNPVTLDLSDHPKLVAVGQQPLQLAHYDQLLKGGPNGN